jgi:hypothetical protein
VLTFADSKGGRNSKNKKKNRRRKEQAKDSSSNNPNENQKKVSISFSIFSSAFPCFMGMLCSNRVISSFAHHE